jgi:RNA polymerase sigma-70 factor, ECF subfamily
MSNPSNSSSDRTDDFLRLLARHERRLEGYVLALMPNWANAEEIIQETKLRLWQQFDEYDSAKDFGAWACTIAHFQVLTFRNRSRSQQSLLSQLFVEKVASIVSERHDELTERARLLSECLKKLTVAKQELLKMRYSDRRTIVQVAAELGRKSESVRQELLRIRQTLYRCIQSNGSGK